MRERRPELDGLRAFAVAAVIGLHAAPATLPGGFLGVDVFFVLSGFLVTESLLGDRDAAGRLRIRDFYARRVGRIWPALATMLLTVVAVALFAALVSDAGDLPRLLARAAVAAASLTNWAVALRFDAGGPFMHTWSLSLEEQFYLLWPVALTLLLRLPSRRAAVAVLVAAIVAVTAWRMGLAMGGAHPARTYAGLDTRIDAVLIGCVLALVGVETVPARPLRWLVPACVGLLAVALFQVAWKSPVLPRGGFTVLALCAVVLVAAALRPDPVTRFVLGNRIAVWVGLRSYGIYLWHVPILYWATPTFGHNLLTAVSALAATLAVAALSHRYVERPFLRRGGAAAPDPSSRGTTAVRASS